MSNVGRKTENAAVNDVFNLKQGATKPLKMDKNVQHETGRDIALRPITDY